MYPTVPRTVPAAVRAGEIVAVSASPSTGRTTFASPKSRILIRPSLVRKTFSGLRSRWVILVVRRGQTVDHRARVLQRLAVARPPFAITWRSDSPSKSSVTA